MKVTRSWLDKWIVAINQDSACINNGRSFNGEFTIAVDHERYTFSVHKGKVEQVLENVGPLARSSFTLAAAGEVWSAIFQPSPVPMRQTIFAAIATSAMQFEGDISLLFQQMATLSAWIEVGRSLVGEVRLPDDPVWREDWQATGRYTNVIVDGCRHKVFYFEAGEGIPVLCQHTAGNENREWWHLLEDRELTKKYRFIAYDLPAHGKSDPSFDKDFFSSDQPLKSEWITNFVMSFSESLNLQRPIFLGCSIGGVIALHLAERFPEKFRGFIALAGAVPTYGFYHDWWIDSSINVPMMESGLVDAVTSPNMSRADRQLNRMFQGAHPRSLRNDLHLWGVDNSDEGRADRIDAEKTPIFMYAGEYDFTCPPEHVEASAKRIGPNVHYEMLKGLGHFPMSENYELFRPVLVRTLEEIMQGERELASAG
jgi:pimeloyl-ACP methyl ester carboxylesterase